MGRVSNYEKFPVISVGAAQECSVGWAAIAERLRPQLTERGTIAVECYPGVASKRVLDELRNVLPGFAFFSSEDCLKTPAELHALLDPMLGTDRVFTQMSDLELDAYFDAAKLAQMRSAVEQAAQRGPAVVVGTGATLVSPSTAAVVYADLARWEIQLRWRRGEMGNLGLDNVGADFSAKYKCGFFIEWRAADRLKRQLWPRIDFLLDTNASSIPVQSQAPKMIAGDAFRRALAHAGARPFRVVPYFDPGPWGGHWMEEVCDLPHDKPNHAWCFDCVPEENSLLFGFGDQIVEVPAIDLVFSHPRELLGEAVYARFGAEFPIRFDFLDTMGGGNLSLQVHPLTDYIRDLRHGLHAG